ncbi:MAG: ATP-binding protein [Candidatus Bathyarchaeota archaeon]|nr:ATP-binding protein [Candidatus Bathyarchaeota archaeon]
MIERLQMTNFKGVKEGSIDLSPITILVGSNNSAKSTILEALFMGMNPFRPVPYFIPKAVNNPSTVIDVLSYLHKTLDYEGFAFLLYNYSAKEAEIKYVSKELEANQSQNKNWLKLRRFYHKIYFTSSNSAVNTEKTQMDEETIRYFGRASMDDSKCDVFTFDTLLAETLLVSPKLIVAGYDYLRHEWATVVNSKIARTVAKDISTLSPEQYIDFTMEPVIGGKLDINAYLEDGRRIRLGDLGEGIQSYFLSRILFELANPKILLWDDIESHLNPRILTALAEWFGDLVKQGKQVVISTHSLEAARVIAGINQEQTCVCLSFLKDSVLDTRSLSIEQMENLKTAGIDARTTEALLI